MSAILRRRPGLSRFASAAAAVLLAVTVTRAEVYWVNYDPAKDEPIDGGQLPEQCACEPPNCWVRVFGNGNGGPPGDIRWVDGVCGCLGIDSRMDGWSYDYAQMNRPINPDSGAGERAIFTWRFLIADSVSYGDAGVGLCGDVSEEIVFLFRHDRIFSLREQWEYFFTPGVFHTFRLTSPYVGDGEPYRLWIDNELVHAGYWDGPTFEHSSVSFGDLAMGPGTSGSLSYWDAFRFGIIRPGDVNMDDTVSLEDIDPFIDALSMSEDGFRDLHPTCSWLAADCNGDGQVDFDDIDPLIVLLEGP